MAVDFKLFLELAPDDRARELKQLIEELELDAKKNKDDIDEAERLLTLAEEEIHFQESELGKLEDRVEAAKEEKIREAPLEKLIEDIERKEPELEKKDTTRTAYERPQQAYKQEEEYSDVVKTYESERQQKESYKGQGEKPDQLKTASEQLKDDVYKDQNAYKAGFE